MKINWTRREFLSRSGTAAGVAGLGVSGPPAETMVNVPTEEAIFGWIRTIFSQGIRRPGYPADVWAEGWIERRFRRLGLENVRREPVAVQRWTPRHASLRVIPAAGGARTLRCFAAPHTAPAGHLDLELAAFDAADPAAVAGKASLYDVRLLRLPADLGLSASAPERVVDPDGTMAGAVHVLPFGPELLNVMEPSIAAGAAAFVGSLADYPGDSFHYYVPYDGVRRPIPGVWIRGSDGAWLRDRLAAGPVRVRLTACRAPPRGRRTTWPASCPAPTTTW